MSTRTNTELIEYFKQKRRIALQRESEFREMVDEVEIAQRAPVVVRCGFTDDEEELLPEWLDVALDEADEVAAEVAKAESHKATLVAYRTAYAEAFAQAFEAIERRREMA